MSAIQRMKVKTVLAEDDIRVHFIDVSSPDEAFRSLKESIAAAYPSLKRYRITATDEEGDQITLADQRDLMDILEMGKKESRIPKFFIVDMTDKKQKSTPAVIAADKDAVPSGTTNDNDNDNDQTEKKEDTAKPESEEKPEEDSFCALAKKLVQDLQNAQFRGEFGKFLVDFVTALRESVDRDAEDAFARAMSAHDSVFEHPTMKRLAPMFPALMAQFQPMLFFLTSINVEMIPVYLEHFAANAQRACDENVLPFLPPFLQGVCGATRGAHPPPPPFAFPGFFGGFPGAPPPPPETTGNGAPSATEQQQNEDGSNPQNWSGIPPGLFNPFMGGGFGGRCGGRGAHRGRHGRGRGFGGCHQPPRCHRKNEEREWAAEIVETTLASHVPVMPKQVVVQSWRLKNTGVHDWEGVTVQYRGRPFNPLVNGTQFPVEVTRVGEEATVSVVIEAPALDGENSDSNRRISSNWRLVTVNGHVFGPRLTCSVTVVSDNDKDAKADQRPIVSRLESSDDDVVLVDKKEAKAAKKAEIAAKKADNAAKKADKAAHKAARKVQREQALAAKREKLQAQLAQIEQKLSNVDESSSGSGADALVEAAPAEAEAPKPDEQPQEQPQEQPVNEEMAVPVEQQVEEPFEYQMQLNALLGMGFDEEMLRNLLVVHNGSMDQVLAAVLNGQ